ncbi:F-actin-capping protein subunit alpha isoform X1 [Musa acuminata AAA Group]|uniref:F-actin-capping protein subunit alpha isoform X1 n=1 Tax=Musa acuminata AAA Group TaxID=214697 RepID=UPI0031D6EBCD
MVIKPPRVSLCTNYTYLGSPHHSNPQNFGCQLINCRASLRWRTEEEEEEEMSLRSSATSRRQRSPNGSSPMPPPGRSNTSPRTCDPFSGTTKSTRWPRRRPSPSTTRRTCSPSRCLIEAVTTAQVATVDHVKQVCTNVRPANDDELPSPYIEDFRSTLDAELSKYVGETYPKGVCAVYCVSGKDAEGPGADFEFVVVISAVKHSPQNFCNGIWQSIWNIEFKDDLQFVEIKGKIQVGAHYFEEGNVQLDAKLECKDSTIFQSPEDSAVSITNIVRHHETEYLASLEASYVNLPDTTFKDLRRKLPVTRTLFPWQNTMQFSLTRDITKEMGIGK